MIRLLSDMSAETICNHFTSVLAEYALPSVIIADFGTQYISQKFNDNCAKNGITIMFSSPYHHQANSLAERAVGMCKSLWKKVVESSKKDLQSRHPDNENHQEKNYERQQRQAEANDKKASTDKREQV